MFEIIFKLNKNSNEIHVTTLLAKVEPTDLLSHYKFCFTLALNREEKEGMGRPHLLFCILLTHGCKDKRPITNRTALLWGFTFSSFSTKFCFFHKCWQMCHFHCGENYLVLFTCTTKTVLSSPWSIFYTEHLMEWKCSAQVLLNHFLPLWRLSL